MKRASVLQTPMRIRTQFAIQLGGGILNTLVLLAFTPILVRTLGLERYGVLLLVLGFALYAGLAEFGVGMATARFIAKAEDELERSRVLGASLMVSAPLAAVAGGLFACLSFRDLGMKVGLSNSVAIELENARAALFFLGMSLVLSSVLSGLMYGLQRFIALNLISLLSTATYTLAPAGYAVVIGHDISGLIWSVDLGQLLLITVGMVLCGRAHFYPVFRGVDATLIRELFHYGAWSTLGSALHRATNSIDRPFIGALIGAATIPFFAVPQSIVSRSSIVVGALTGSVFPRLSRLEGTSAYRELLKTCYRSACSLAPLYIIGILVFPLFLKFWLGSAFAESAAAVAILLGLAGWLDAIGSVPYAALTATHKISRESKLASLVLLPNLGLLCISLIHFGILGDWGGCRAQCSIFDRPNSCSRFEGRAIDRHLFANVPRLFSECICSLSTQRTCARGLLPGRSVCSCHYNKRRTGGQRRNSEICILEKVRERQRSVVAIALFSKSALGRLSEAGRAVKYCFLFWRKSECRRYRDQCEKSADRTQELLSKHRRIGVQQPSRGWNCGRLVEDKNLPLLIEAFEFFDTTIGSGWGSALVSQKPQSISSVSKLIRHLRF